MRHLPLVGVLLLCLCTDAAMAQATPGIALQAPGLPAAPQAPAPAASDPRPAYQANLMACVVRAKACDRAALSASDRNYR